MIHSIAPNHINNTTNPHQAIFKTFDILKIERVLNTRLWEKYMRRKQEVIDDILNFNKLNDISLSEEVTETQLVNEELLWHGSPAINSIIRKGFDERHASVGGMFGAGIYFAENSSKSNNYIYGINGGNGCSLHSDKSCYVCSRKILLCQVLLGKQLSNTSSVKHAHAPPGHHSLLGKPSKDGLMFAEHVIYRGEQAYPTFLITYKLVK